MASVSFVPMTREVRMVGPHSRILAAVRPLIPVALFASLACGAIAAVVAADSGAVAPCIAGLAVLALSTGGLAAYVLRADSASDSQPHARLTEVEFEASWPEFERALWSQIDGTPRDPDVRRTEQHNDRRRNGN
jgi:hypothetical protein